MYLWRGDYGPFIHYAQFDFGRRLIVVPLTTFHRLSELIGDPKGELVFLFNTARCGSTLLAQVRMVCMVWRRDGTWSELLTRDPTRPDPVNERSRNLSSRG